MHTPYARRFPLIKEIVGMLDFTTLLPANFILVLAMILFLGTLGGFIFKLLHLPQVVGYIAIGILIGQTGFHLLNSKIITTLSPISNIALSLIGFLVGAELKISVLKKYGKQFTAILLFESITPFITVAFSVGLVSYLVTHQLKSSIALGLLLGAMSSATAPAATTDVLAENRTKGPLTTTLLGIVAMDDAVALILFAIVSTIAGGLLGERTGSLLSQLLAIIYNITVSSALGALAGLLLNLLAKWIKNDNGRILAFALGIILLLTGVGLYLQLDTILSAMAMGFFIVNFAKFKTDNLFNVVDRFTPPIYVLFFVLVGAKINIWSISPFFAILAVVYVLARTFGKSIGSSFGAKITNAPDTVRKYMKWCLLSQAGVAIGLSMSAGQMFPHTVGPTIIMIITATTFIVQLIGPISVKHGVTKAGEVGLDVTEEDLIRESKVSDILAYEKKAPPLNDNATFEKVLETFSRQESLSSPVCSSDNKLVGIITVDNLKEALLLGDVAEGLLAYDLMNPSGITCKPDCSLLDVKEMFQANNVDTIPIVDDKGTFVGIIEQRSIEKYFRRKVLELHEKLSSLEKTTLQPAQG